MALLLNGWAGDNAGGVVGRKPNTLIVAITLTNHTRYPYGLDEAFPIGRTVAVYPAWGVDCLTPNAREALAITISQVNHTFEIEVAEVDLDHNKDPWTPGVHLFGIELFDEHSGLSTTIATAVINEDAPRLDAEQVTVSKMWKMGRSFDKSPRRDWP